MWPWEGSWGGPSRPGPEKSQVQALSLSPSGPRAERKAPGGPGKERRPAAHSGHLRPNAAVRKKDGEIKEGPTAEMELRFAAGWRA